MLAYLLPALVLFLEVGFPLGFLVPGGDTLLLFLGALAGEGKLSLFPLLPLLFLGSALGHLLGYAL
ncbi:MAG: alkaline phosphatase, partial [Thermus sp.]|nr:alkaline phosphatase [Thermus sp.]